MCSAFSRLYKYSYFNSQQRKRQHKIKKWTFSVTVRSYICIPTEAFLMMNQPIEAIFIQIIILPESACRNKMNHTHLCMCMQTHYTHTTRSISWSFWLPSSITSYSSFSCKRHNNKHINHMNILSPCQQITYTAHQHWPWAPLWVMHIHTYPHIMELWKVR